MPLIKADGAGLLYLLRVGGPGARLRALARALDEPAQAVVGGALGEAPEMAHLREQGGDPVGALGVGHPPAPPPRDLERNAREGRHPPDEVLVAVDDLQVVAAPAARPRHGARALERPPEVCRPVRGRARTPGEAQLVRGLYGAVAPGPHGVPGPPEAVRLRRVEPGLETELRAPEPHGRAGDRGARGAERDAVFVPGTRGVHQPGELRPRPALRSHPQAGGQLPADLRGERGQPRTPPPPGGPGRA